VRLRLWPAHWPADGDGTPGARDGHHHAERQRLRRGTERRLESHPRVLEGADAGQPGRAAYAAVARNDLLAGHDWRHGYVPGYAVRLQPVTLLPDTTDHAQ